MTIAKGSQELANEYVLVHDELDAAQRNERSVHSIVEEKRKRLAQIANKLLECVGQNITTKVFQVTGSSIVIVEHERGVRILEPEH